MSPAMWTLWPFQTIAVQKIRELIRDAIRVILLVAPVGAGKTAMFSYIIYLAALRGTPVLVLAHRKELIDQAVDKIVAFGVDPRLIGVIRADDPRRNPNALIQVGSVDTLVSRGRFPTARLVIIDEAHRSLAASYVRIVGQYPNAVIIGVTASPWRMDGRGLGSLYQRMVVAATVSELIAGGYLVRPVAYSHPEPIDVTGVKMSGGDYDEDDLARAIDAPRLIGNATDHWMRRSGGASTILFAATIEHSKLAARGFQAIGVPAEHVDGKTPERERDAIFARFRSGETRVLANLNVATEGFDAPRCKCVILARPTKSRALYVQATGRAMRSVRDAPELTTCLILDHAGCVLEHGLPQDPQDYSLGDPAPRRAGVASVKQCPQCQLMVPSATRVCPVEQNGCGYAFPVAAPEPIKEEDGELVEVKQTEAREKRALRRAIQAMAVAGDAARGWDYGEVNRILLQEYGVKREKMALPALRDVHAYLISGRFDAKYPRPVAAVASPVDPAAWDWTV